MLSHSRYFFASEANTLAPAPHLRPFLHLLYPQALCLLLILVLPISGCTNAIIPPPPPANPVTVYLLDHGRHPSLVLPGPNGNLIRYVYGDWSWYALRKTGILEAFDAILIPSQAGLGRWEHDSPHIQAVLQLAPAEKVIRIPVEQAQADQLREKLDTLFQANIDTLHVNQVYHLAFVHHPESYWLCHNSNRVAADWLRDLGARVRGLEILSEWRLRPSDQ